jgi:hypothetical protein
VVVCQAPSEVARDQEVSEGLASRSAGPRLPYQTDEQLSVGDIVNLSPRAGNPHIRLCDQERLARSVGGRPTEVKVRSLVAWIAERRGIESLKLSTKPSSGW